MHGRVLGPDDGDAFSLEVVFCFIVLSQTQHMLKTEQSEDR